MNQLAPCEDDQTDKPEGDRTENTAGARSLVEGLMRRSVVT